MNPPTILENGIVMGHRSYGSPIRMGQGNKVTIGSWCSIGSNVCFDSGYNHDTSFISTYPFHTFGDQFPSNMKIKGDIYVGNDCWLGNDVIVMSNVKIGHGAVIGTRCIVSKDVQPYEIVVGAPQKVLRKRFTDEQIEKLLKLAWWDFPEEEVLKIAPLLMSNNLEELFKLYVK